MLNIDSFEHAKLEREPYRWGFINDVFSPANKAKLAATYPRDKMKTIQGYDGEKSYRYVARSLIHMGADEPSHPEGLSREWRDLAKDFLSPEYRNAVSTLTGRDLSDALLEVNVMHYGAGAWLGPHLDLKEKLSTHVFYFNESWESANGGCLRILRSADPDDLIAEVLPVVGNSALILRAENSWHMVSRVAEACQLSRRSVNVIFHAPGSVSSMWPPGDKTPLSDLKAESGLLDDAA